ncbi:MAG: hypothetical protein GF317_21685 [Candidatus Lokiarchaeota archaeon]|nr:hypothetical protein [Candidatus Lokiarchaeota archaeon]MBD3202073.1 hypothetical protein [Candidatus Lokiarchaeota archaeon]
MPRRKKKLKYSRKLACKHLKAKGNISSSLQPLCDCPERELVLGTKPYVCQVCELYSESDTKITEVYSESKKEAEKLIKEKEAELEALGIGNINDEEEIDLSIEEFEEDEEELSDKFEKIKAGKGVKETEEFTEVECPFCGELFDNLATHVQNCEFAPDDVDLDDYIPSKPKKKKRKTTKEEKDTINCPYCGKEYVRLSRHLPYCDDRPEDPDEEKEELYMDEKIDLEEFKKG